MMTSKSEANGYEEIEALLPWHAAGTLSQRDAARVERALKTDKELARRYDLVREELAETIHLNETLGAPSTSALDRLFKKIDAEAPRTRRVSLDLTARIATFIAGFSPRTLAFSAAAAALAIMLQAGVITGVLIKDRGTQGFETASQGAAQSAADGVFVRVRFNPQASAADITKFLEANKASIVGGPTGSGMFRVKVAVTVLPKAEIARLVKQMQDDKAVGIVASE
jgi:anti-sigma factor RsiW